jgi:FMN phosphatase YigB (HAD superfamily)
MRFDAIVLDCGNTLVPIGEEHDTALFREIGRTIARVHGPVPDFAARAKTLRDGLQNDRLFGSMRELTVAELTDAFFEGGAPDGIDDAVAATIHDTCVETLRVPPHVPALLDRLRARRPLAMLSNFLLASPVEAVLERAGIRDKFVHVEVSATRGWMKPHPEPFEVVREALGTPMERTLMVGDDFWADVVGGHRAGFLTALTREYRRGPTWHPRATDVRADRLLERLDELADER